MNTIKKILALHPVSAVRIENPPFMPLSIERIGADGPHGREAVSVCHYGEQNGDLMRDPEICFEIAPDGTTWTPYYFRNDYTGTEQRTHRTNEAGQLLKKPNLIRDLTEFAAQWDKNIHAQGFLEAAKAIRNPAAA